jgi:hypothetical protein
MEKYSGIVTCSIFFKKQLSDKVPGLNSKLERRRTYGV